MIAINICFSALIRLHEDYSRNSKKIVDLGEFPGGFITRSGELYIFSCSEQLQSILIKYK